MRLLAHYTFAWVVLVFYGVQVCPLIAALSYAQLGLPLAMVLVGAAVLRPTLVRRWVLAAPVPERSARVFWMDLGLLVGVGLVMTALHVVGRGFDLGSGLKLTVGTAAVGMFAALDLALEWERHQIRAAALQSVQDLRLMSSLTRRFEAAAVGLVGMFSVVVGLIVTNDLHWLSGLPLSGMVDAYRVILLEIGVVGGAFLAQTLNLVRSFTTNLGIFFDNETRVLERVAAGQLDQYVDVGSADEFGLIASRTNQMIDGLKERDQIKQLFGKMVSPAVGRRMMAAGSETLRPGGSRKEVVVLFADIRQFTTWAEAAGPEVVVRDLNTYFGEMVALIHQHDGVVDKFIGDGIMAVFGLDDPAQACEKATRAAVAMSRALGSLRPRLTRPVEIGIGIHKGEVVAGLIGAPERLEFTFIGDTVNVTARLEALTRALGADVLISAAAFAPLPPDLKALPWLDLGPQPLKGKVMMVPVMGLPCGALGSSAGPMAA